MTLMREKNNAIRFKYVIWLTLGAILAPDIPKSKTSFGNILQYKFYETKNQRKSTGSIQNPQNQTKFKSY